MFFGSWAIGTGIICLIGFSYMFYASLTEAKIESADSENSETEA
jgi:hypothetical protein|tara:strand:- start:81919 stop:82050 length:132 start_codon:yes stop_codon:yes gene_type:complete